MLLFGQGSYFKHITIDGNFADWNGIPAAYVDPQENPNATDIQSIYLAHDADYIYVRLKLYAPADPFTSRNNYYIDTDANASTGFGGGRGSELLIQSGAGYQESGGQFNEGGVDGISWQAAPTGSDIDFEFRISRGATYQNDGASVFTSNLIQLYFQGQTPTFVTVENAPDTGSIAYDLSTTAPPFPHGNVGLVDLTASPWSVNDSGTDLGTAWLAPDYDPSSNPGWKTGTGLFGFSEQPNRYPAPLKTTFSSTTPTVYLRTTFEWNYDSSGIIFFLTNYLSDGVVIYLNGEEIGRRRIPDSPVVFRSTANGGPDTPGQAEVFSFPSSLPVLGVNILEAEVHQSVGDTRDLVFGLSLTATDSVPVFITDPTEPSDRKIIEGFDTKFVVAVEGSEPFTYQWYKNDNRIEGATSSNLILSPVLQSDAGEYFVEVSNGLGTVRSRKAKLTTQAIPVHITNPALPADLTVFKGRSADFEVQASGSAVIRYQWYHNGKLLSGETNRTLHIDNVVLSDGGEYTVQVSNRLPQSETSRAAVLRVNEDVTGPKPIKVLGSASKIYVTFDEPVDAVSAAVSSHYKLDGGITISGVSLDPADGTRVTLTTSAQKQGTHYSLSVEGIKDLFGNASVSTTVVFQSTILIDGSFDDWSDIPAIAEDPQDTNDATDWKQIFITNDDDYIFVRIVLHSPTTWPTSFYYNNLFIDADNNPQTGYHPFAGMGSEFLIQGGGGYQEKGGGFNEGNVSDLGWDIAPQGSADEFEFRISRHATYEADHSPVFTHSGFQFLLESENTSYVTRDKFPDSGVLAYKFQPEQLEPLVSNFSEGTWTLSWTEDSILQSRDSLTSGTWQDEPDQSNPHTLTLEGLSKYYRLVKP